MTKYPLYRRLSGSQGRFGWIRNNLAANQIRSPDSPARRESVYRLCYQVPLVARDRRGKPKIPLGRQKTVPSLVDCSIPQPKFLTHGHRDVSARTLNLQVPRFLKCSVVREQMDRIIRNRALGCEKTEFQGASGTNRGIRTNVIR
jgi:hypothetical protein